MNNSEQQLTNDERPCYPTNGRMHSEMTGLTKREYFAAMAMQGLLSILDSCNQGHEPNMPNVKCMVALSIKAADELLKRLES